MRTGRFRRPLVIATALSAAAALTGCSGLGGEAYRSGSEKPVVSAAEVDPDDPTREDLDAVQRLLVARAAAAIAGDEKAFMRTVDPEQPRLRAQQRTLFSNLERLDLTRMSYDLDRETLLVPAGVPGKEKTFRPQVDEYVQLEGTLTLQVVNPVQMTFVQRASGWYVGAENQRKVTTSSESPQERPWFGGPIAVRRDGQMTVLVDRERAGDLDDLVASIREDIAYAADKLDVEPAYRLLVDATSNGLNVDFSKLNKTEVAAFSFGLYGLNGRVGSAIKLNPDNVQASLDQEGLMRHELTHYLLNGYSGVLPRWLGEGVAMYVENWPGDMNRYQVQDEFWDQLQAADRDLPGVGSFNLDPDRNYFISWAAVVRLIDRAGIDDLKRLMAAYKKAHDGPNVDALTPRLLRKVYDLREKDLVDQTFDELAQLHH